ncbi:MAG TPA: methyltransferase [Trebonia sp.]
MSDAERAVTPPSAQDYERMMSMVTGFWVTQITRAAAVFNLADHIGAGRSTAPEIARAESADPDATRRLLRACASIGLVTTRDGDHYAGTSLLETLRGDSPGSLRGFAVSQAASGHWLSWGRFPEAVRSGIPQTHNAYGSTIFEYFAQPQNGDEARAFTESMWNLSKLNGEAVARVLDTKEVKFALDLGGASGDLLHSVMLANPNLEGAVLDRPHVLPDAVAAASEKGLRDRFSVVEGDFFKEVPPAGLYLLRYILHDWSDEQCVQILGNCRASLAEGGRVAVVDHLIGKIGEPGIAPLMDMNMLVMAPGREREIDEFDALFAAAGLRRIRVTPAGNMALIEAVADDA